MQDVLVAPFGRVVNPLLERSLKVWHRLGTTSEPHSGTEVISASLARPTVITRDTNLQRDSVTNLEPRHGFANGYDYTG
jgi:hypothetical protein